MEEFIISRNDSFQPDFKKKKDLPHGENPHQEAGIFCSEEVLDYEILSIAEPSFANLLDADLCLRILSGFYDVNCCVITNHSAIAGAALGQTLKGAWLKALDCSPASILGGAAGFTKTVDESTAKELASIPLEIVISPDYTEKALDILRAGKNLKIIKINTPLEKYKNYLPHDIKNTPFGALIQEADKGELNKDSFKIVSKTKPNQEMIEDMIFAWKILKHAKSNSAVIVKDFKLLGIGQGMPDIISAFEYALNRACDGAKEAIAAFDGGLASAGIIQTAAQERISGIIYTGGGAKDAEIIKEADKYNIAAIKTGISHFKH